MVSRKAHNLEIVGSNPAPATLRRDRTFVRAVAIEAKMWFVYILECEDGSFYTGITNDLERRFSEHKAGLGGHYTASHAVTKRVYSEICETRSEALKREAEIKRMTRAKKIDLIEK